MLVPDLIEFAGRFMRTGLSQPWMLISILNVNARLIRRIAPFDGYVVSIDAMPDNCMVLDGCSAAAVVSGVERQLSSVATDSNGSTPAIGSLPH